MFFPGSRYLGAETYTVVLSNGRMVRATKIPLPRTDPLIGLHQRREDQRLDLLASHYLADSTAFWRLCDANNSIAPDALAARDQIGIPTKGR